VLGIRPEHLELAAEGFEGVVSVVEPTGPETLVFMRHEQQELAAVFHERHDFRPGQTVRVKPRQAAIHWFDPATGQALQTDT